jgi:hypothetical protein
VHARGIRWAYNSIEEVYRMDNQHKGALDIWKARVGRWKQGGIPLKTFCEQEGITEGQLYYWQRRVQRVGKHEPEDQQSYRFLEVSLNESNPDATQSMKRDPRTTSGDRGRKPRELDFELRLSSGCLIRVPHHFNSDALRKLIDVVEGLT